MRINQHQSSKSSTKPIKYMKIKVSNKLGSRAGKGSERLLLGPWMW
jgi:hypothetical protein